MQINPESSSAISSLGNVLKFKGKLTEALAHYKRALKLNVNQPNTLMELMNTKLACCDWENYDEYFQHLVNVVTAQVQRGELPCADPFNIFMMNFTSEQKFEIARLYSEHIKQRTLQGLQAIGEPVPQFSFQGSFGMGMIGSFGNKIRLGYISYDFADHPLAHLLQSIFQLHDRSKFHVVAFSLRESDNSSYRQSIQQGCDEFIQVPQGLNAANLASFINSKNIQILFNLNGWTNGHRTDVFTLRPAPIQI